MNLLLYSWPYHTHLHWSLHQFLQPLLLWQGCTYAPAQNYNKHIVIYIAKNNLSDKSLLNTKCKKADISPRYGLRMTGRERRVMVALLQDFLRAAGLTVGYEVPSVFSACISCLPVSERPSTASDICVVGDIKWVRGDLCGGASFWCLFHWVDLGKLQRDWRSDTQVWLAQG